MPSMIMLLSAAYYDLTMPSYNNPIVTCRIATSGHRNGAFEHRPRSDKYSDYVIQP